MKKEILDQLLGNAENNFEAVVKAVAVKPGKITRKYKNDLTPMEEYHVEDHPVFDTTKRRDRTVKSEGNKTSELKPVNRIGLAIEPMISSRAAAFLCANPIVYQATPNSEAEENMWAAFNRVNEQSKLDFKNMSILETRMSELQVAEIWYLDELEEDDDYWSGVPVNPVNRSVGRPRLFLAQPSYQDTLYPVWSGQDKLLAIGREYSEKENGKEIKHFDLYTNDFIYEGVQQDGKWTVNKVLNQIRKIPAVYHEQADTEWAKVRTIIRRLEDIASNFADSNDRTAFPMLLLKGKPTGLPQGVADKALQVETSGDASYLVPPHAPDAIKLEVETLLRYLHSLTDTPDISFENMKGIGATSGFALEMMFMGAHLKAARHAGTFGECLQRRINLIKKMLITIDPSLKDGMSLAIKPTFDYFLPKDLAGIIDYLSTATGSKPIMSQETAVNTLAGVIGSDSEDELTKIQNEAKAATESARDLDDQFK